MKFGIFYEHQLPRPWDERSELQLITDALDQVELADRLGIQYVWEVEHHFLEEYSHSSAPEIFLAACSQRTTNIRLGPRHHPDRAGLQPPGPHRRAHRHPRPGLEGPGRVRLGRVGLRGRARRLRHRSRGQARGVARGSRGRAALHDRGAVHRRRRPVRADAAPQRRAQAGAEAAPSAVGGVQPTRHHPAGRREGHRRPELRVHRARGCPSLGAGLRGHPDATGASPSARPSTHRSRA